MLCRMPFAHRAEARLITVYHVTHHEQRRERTASAAPDEDQRVSALKRALLWASNVVAIVGLLALASGTASGLWQVLPDATRQVFTDPRAAVEGARRGVNSGPASPLTNLGNWLREWLADRRDRTDVVHSADGASRQIAPLPSWTSTDGARVFGATETLWQSRRAKLSGARWSRVVFFWTEIQPRGPRDWRASYYLRDDLIRRERTNGVEVVGLLMSTPAWAAVRAQDGGRAVPAGLSRPPQDPQNTWATFVRKMTAEYRGRIDTWIMWNEPDIRAGGSNAQYHTWAGDEHEYALLLKAGYLAAKDANPNARVLFGSTTYWADANAGNPLFLERVLDVLRLDPEAAAHGFYFDAVALNLYAAPDDLRRVAGVYRDVLNRYGLTKPLWLTETNAVPYDDPGKGLAREQNGLRVTLEQQAAFVVQAYAMGMAAGYERIAIHSMVDRDTQDELWGLVRNDGTLRPAFVAYQTAARHFGGARRAVFAGRERPVWRWHRDGYLPNWQLYLVVLEREPEPRPTGSEAAASAERGVQGAHGRQRVSVVWSGDPEPKQITLRRVSDQATLVDKYGRAQSVEAVDDRWRFTLPPATAHSPLDPEGYYFIGGDPLLLIEEGVPEGAPVDPPDVAD